MKRLLALAVLCVAALAAGASAALGPTVARASVCAGQVGQPPQLSGDDMLFEGGQQSVNYALTHAVSTGSQAEADRAVARLAAIQPCSPAGLALQQDKIAFLGYQLAAAVCRKIVESNPSIGGVVAMLTCLAPVNAALVRLEHEMAQLGAKMFKINCDGQGVSGVTASKAIASVRSRVAQTKKVAGTLEAVVAVTSEAMGAADETELVEGYNHVVHIAEVVAKATEVAKKAVDEKERTTSGVTSARELPQSAQLWLSLLEAADGFGATFQKNVTTMTKSLRAGKRAQARAAAALAQFHADQLAVALEGAIQAQGHLPDDLKAEAALATPVSQDVVNKAKQQVTAAATDPALRAGATSVNLDAFAGQPALSLLNSPELVRSEKRLVSLLESLGLLAALDGRAA